MQHLGDTMETWKNDKRKQQKLKRHTQNYSHQKETKSRTLHSMESETRGEAELSAERGSNPKQLSENRTGRRK